MNLATWLKWGWQSAVFRESPRIPLTPGMTQNYVTMKCSPPLTAKMNKPNAGVIPLTLPETSSRIPLLSSNCRVLLLVETHSSLRKRSATMDTWDLTARVTRDLRTRRNLQLPTIEFPDLKARAFPIPSHDISCLRQSRRPHSSKQLNIRIVTRSTQLPCPATDFNNPCTRVLPTI